MTQKKIIDAKGREFTETDDPRVKVWAKHFIDKKTAEKAVKHALKKAKKKLQAEILFGPIYQVHVAPATMVPTVVAVFQFRTLKVVTL